MALQLANVALSDTFDTWRVRTNQIIADAASTSNTTTFAANVGFSGFVTTNLVPSANVTYDLGTSGNAWRDLYLSGNTIFLGNATISTGDGRVVISVDGSEVFNAQTGGAGSFDGEVTAPTVTANSFVGPLTGDVTSTGVVSAATVIANTITGTISTATQPNITSVGALNAGSITSGFGNINIGANTVTAGAFIGDGSQLTNAGSTVATGTDNANLKVPFTGVTSGTMTSANVDVNFTYNPATGTLSANNFVGDGSGLTNAGATVAPKSDNVNYNVTFTNQLNGAHANTFVNTSFTFNPSTGDASATNFNSTSDAVWKEEISPIKNASEIISKLSGKAFNWVHSGKKSYGVIAQEVESVLPDVVVENTAGKAVNYNTLIAFLIESNKELQNRISLLEDKYK